jgi:predicted DNA-binding transcriptional regulator AlpA
MAQSKTPTQPIKLLTRGEVLELVGVSYPAIFGWVKEGKFPPGRTIGVGKKGHIAWLESEVIDWIMSRPLRYPKGSKVGKR